MPKSKNKLDAMMQSQGRCLCGAIEFAITGLSGNIYQCHCKLCRLQGGSSSNTGTIVPQSQLTWRKGESHIKNWTKDTGFSTCFCETCGSIVPNRLRGMDYYWIPVGTLDDGPFKIVANIYQNSKASWAVTATDADYIEEMPEVSAFIEQLGNHLHE